MLSLQGVQDSHPSPNTSQSKLQVWTWWPGTQLGMAPMQKRTKIFLEKNFFFLENVFQYECFQQKHCTELSLFTAQREISLLRQRAGVGLIGLGPGNVRHCFSPYAETLRTEPLHSNKHMISVTFYAISYLSCYHATSFSVGDVNSDPRVTSIKMFMQRTYFFPCLRIVFICANKRLGEMSSCSFYWCVFKETSKWSQYQHSVTLLKICVLTVGPAKQPSFLHAPDSRFSVPPECTVRSEISIFKTTCCCHRVC